MARRDMTKMSDCKDEETIRHEEDGWGVTLTRYESVVSGETGTARAKSPNGRNMHAAHAKLSFPKGRAREYLNTTRAIMGSPHLADAAGREGGQRR